MLALGSIVMKKSRHFKEHLPSVNCREGGDPHEVHEGLDEAHEGEDGEVLVGKPGVKRQWQ